jgi:hypothetical protein
MTKRAVSLSTLRGCRSCWGIRNEGRAETRDDRSRPQFLKYQVQRGQALAYVYSRATVTDAMQAKVLTDDEARRVAINIARLPELLGHKK